MPGPLDNYKSPGQQGQGSPLDNYQSAPEPSEAATSAPQSAAPYKSPGEGDGFLSDVKARISDPERWKAIAGMDSPAKQDAVSGSVPMAVPAAGLPAGALKLAEFLNASGPRRIAMGAAQGVVSDPEHPVAGGLKGAAMSAVPEGLGKFLKGSGDVAMQAAVGRKKYTPGVGTTLADEGIWGTRKGMTEQVNNQIKNRAEELHELAAEIPGKPMDSVQMARNVFGSVAKPYAVPGAAPSAADVPKLETIWDFGMDMASRGAETGAQGLQRRIAAGQRSYRGKEDPLQSLLGQLSKGEQIQYSGALKGAHEAATGTKEFANADKAYGALKRAQTALAEEPKIPRSLFGLATVPATMMPGGSVAASTVGQALTKGGQSVDFLNNPILRQLLLEKAK